MTHLDPAAQAAREQARDPRGRFGSWSAPETDTDQVDLSARPGSSRVDLAGVRPSDLATVTADLDRRVRHTDGASMTLRESVDDGRVTARTVVPQGGRNVYAVLVPDTTTPDEHPGAHLQVHRATWDAIDLPVSGARPDEVVDPATAPSVGTFTSRTTRDASGLERDGQEVVDASRVDEHSTEVQFRDGERMLVDPSELDQGRDVHSRLLEHYRRARTEHRTDPRSIRQQWAQDDDVPMASMPPDHPRRVAAFGAGDVDARLAVLETARTEAEQEASGAHHFCMDCGDPMPGYGPEEFPPDYCDACEGDHEHEY